jgi:hypothetical protein
MKTERRHELQTNVLAHSMARWIEAAKPYSKAGAAVLIAVVVALFAWAWMSTQSNRRSADGWNEYFDATSGRNPDPRALLRDISGRYSGMMVAQWARLTLADIQLDDGTGTLLTDRNRAREELTDASEEFQALLLEASHPTILERATYGLARANEALGDLERARTEYRSLVSQWPESPFASVAESRAKDLEAKNTKVFYDWLAKYEPPPPLTNEPGTPGARPSFLSDPDEGGILDMPPLNPQRAGPALPSVIEGGGETPSTEGGPATEPAPESEKSSAVEEDTAPAAADEKPVEPAPEEKPTAEEPASPEEKPATDESAPGPELK